MAIKHDAIMGRGASIYNVDPHSITIIDGWNPREDFEGEEELLSFIKENGIESIPPLKVRKKKDGTIVLIAGERRLRAVIRAIDDGFPTVPVPCIFTRPTISQSEAMFLTIFENEGKRFNPVEEAEAFNRLRSWGVKVSEIAKRMGKSEVFVYRRLLLIDASEELKNEIKNKNINLTDAEEIIKDTSNIDEQNIKVKKKKTEKVDKVIFKYNKITATMSTKRDLSDEAKDVFFEMLNNIKSYFPDLEELGFDSESMKFEIKKTKTEEC